MSSAGLREVAAEPILRLLQRAASGRAAEVGELFARLTPRFYLDDSATSARFCASPNGNRIVLSVEPSKRLEAHAYAYCVIMSAIGRAEFYAMTKVEREPLLAPADRLLNWAVTRDLQNYLRRPDGSAPPLEGILPIGAGDLESDVLAGLSDEQRLFGRGFFEIAMAFIVFHELAHLEFGHVACSGFDSVEQEQEADLFAIKYLVESPNDDRMHRITRLGGIMVALMWLTVWNVYFGRRNGGTHPEPYNRLFHALDRCIDPNDEDEQGMWQVAATLLFGHMHAASRFHFDDDRMSQPPREQVSYLLDLLSKERDT